MLKIESLTKSFGNHVVLKDLELQVESGSIFGLVGINGAGKSTLLRLIAGVYEPDKGSITFDDNDTYFDETIRSKIAFVSDEQYYPIGATIKSVKVLYKTMYDFDEETYQSYLELFALKENASIASLSKGNKRRVALLFALAIKPKLLLLDEAYDGLEPLVRYKFKRLLTDLIEDEQMTVIISSHNLKELEDICDTFGILEDGKMINYGDLQLGKQNVNKYQVVLKDDTDVDFKDLDILHMEHEGRVYQLVIRGDEEEVTQKLQTYHPILLDHLQVNFEELFIYELEERSQTHENQ